MFVSFKTLSQFLTTYSYNSNNPLSHFYINHTIYNDYCTKHIINISNGSHKEKIFYFYAEKNYLKYSIRKKFRDIMLLQIMIEKCSEVHLKIYTVWNLKNECVLKIICMTMNANWVNFSQIFFWNKPFLFHNIIKNYIF